MIARMDAMLKEVFDVANVDGYARFHRVQDFVCEVFYEGFPALQVKGAVMVAAAWPDGGIAPALESQSRDKPHGKSRLFDP